MCVACVIGVFAYVIDVFSYVIDVCCLCRLHKDLFCSSGGQFRHEEERQHEGAWGHPVAGGPAQARKPVCSAFIFFNYTVKVYNSINICIIKSRQPLHYRPIF